MARQNPIPTESIEEGRRMRALREKFKISRTAFALLCEMPPQQLLAKEAGRTPFRSEELKRIKMAVVAHLAEASRAIEATIAS